MNDGARDLVLGTAGHIDHGKTALVRALTGVDTDRLPAEKERGITIDLGFASLELDGIHLAVVDVPGHERFIRNMLAGASGLDLALLIVAADDSVMPQTREHLEILRLLGLSGGVIAITKCDLVDSSWLDLVEEDVRGLVCGSFLEGAPIVRTSTVSGQGLDLLRDALGRVYSGSRSTDHSRLPGMGRS
jgi:selenocysteine-specific elongation factor